MLHFLGARAERLGQQKRVVFPEWRDKNQNTLIETRLLNLGRLITQPIPSLPVFSHPPSGSSTSLGPSVTSLAKRVSEDIGELSSM